MIRGGKFNEKNISGLKILLQRQEKQNSTRHSGNFHAAHDDIRFSKPLSAYWSFCRCSGV